MCECMCVYACVCACACVCVCVCVYVSACVKTGGGTKEVNEWRMRWEVSNVPWCSCVYSLRMSHQQVGHNGHLLGSTNVC